MSKFNIEDEIEDQETKQNNEQQALNLQVINSLSDRNVRAWIWRILESSGVLASSYRDTNPHGTAFNEGKRSVGLGILDDIIAADPNIWVQIQTEWLNEIRGHQSDEK
ncbi:hypothetical protein L4D77_18365 [Photobacterium frigidiphilum]|uniref:Bbp19 family protein n=1 Tax=Photobacterium frigidiphilum TaxID=264736 RepID=UPI003D11B18C